MRLLDRLRGVKKPAEAVEAPPPRTKWMLTACPGCKRIRWIGVPMPRVVMSEGSHDQYVRVRKQAQPSPHSPNRSATKRVLVNAPLRLIMGKANLKEITRCPCGCEDLRAATTAEERLALTLAAAWRDITNVNA